MATTTLSVEDFSLPGTEGRSQSISPLVRIEYKFLTIK